MDVRGSNPEAVGTFLGKRDRCANAGGSTGVCFVCDDACTLKAVFSSICSFVSSSVQCGVLRIKAPLLLDKYARVFACVSVYVHWDWRKHTK